MQKSEYEAANDDIVWNDGCRAHLARIKEKRISAAQALAKAN
jgi:hypothetical protein